jgi:hypothetical protein
VRFVPVTYCCFRIYRETLSRFSCAASSCNYFFIMLSIVIHHLYPSNTRFSAVPVSGNIWKSALPIPVFLNLKDMYQVRCILVPSVYCFASKFSKMYIFPIFFIFRGKRWTSTLRSSVSRSTRFWGSCCRAAELKRRTLRPSFHQ